MSILSQIEKKIISPENITSLKEDLKSKSIVFTNGCFDILHFGHISYLSLAKELGDILWIGLNSDNSVSKLKGPKRPINSEKERAVHLASFLFVDYVSIFSEETPIELIQKIQPDIHVKGGDYQAETLPEFTTISSYGGKVQILPFIQGKSTSSLIQKIHELG